KGEGPRHLARKEATVLSARLYESSNLNVLAREGTVMAKSMLLAVTIVVALVLLAQPGASQTVGGPVGGVVSGTASGGPPLGWNIFHPTLCFTNGPGLIIYLSEGGALIIFDGLSQVTVLGACQTGNAIAAFFNTPTTFTMVGVFPHH